MWNDENTSSNSIRSGIARPTLFQLAATEGDVQPAINHS